MPSIILEGSKASDPASVEQPQKSSEEALSRSNSDADALSPSSASASFSNNAGRSGVVSFDRPSPKETDSVPSAAPDVPAIKIDEETLVAVSRAIMGRLDVVDLIGRNTAYEAAERVRGNDGRPWIERNKDAGPCTTPPCICMEA